MTFLKIVFTNIQIGILFDYIFLKKDITYTNMIQYFNNLFQN